jgi:hypothetical protein
MGPTVWHIVGLARAVRSGTAPAALPPQTGLRMIQEGFPTHDWITRLASEERRQDAVLAVARSAAARDAALVTTHGPRLLESLAMMIASDVERFRQEFPDDLVRHIAVDMAPDGGFEVRRSAYPCVTLNVAPQWTSKVVGCRYRFTPGPALPVREDRFALGFAPLQDDACFKHQGSGQLFISLPALSEYLLTPVFTGRPRIG